MITLTLPISWWPTMPLLLLNLCHLTNRQCKLITSSECIATTSQTRSHLRARPRQIQVLTRSFHKPRKNPRRFPMPTRPTFYFDPNFCKYALRTHVNSFRILLYKQAAEFLSFLSAVVIFCCHKILYIVTVFIGVIPLTLLCVFSCSYVI
jgi:hypothetical protein